MMLLNAFPRKCAGLGRAEFHLSLIPGRTWKSALPRSGFHPRRRHESQKAKFADEPLLGRTVLPRSRDIRSVQQRRSTKVIGQFSDRSAALRRRQSSGFTLIELVISSALTAMILVSAYVCLRGAVSSQKLIETRADALQTARVAMSLLTADLRSASVLSKDYEFIGMSRMIEKVEADNIDFGTHNYSPRALREGDFCEVSYFVQKSEETDTYSLWRRRDPTPDPEPFSGGKREQIAENILGIRFEYYDGFEWFDEWGDPDGRRLQSESLLDPGNLTGMPDAVRITLLMDSNQMSDSKTSLPIENRDPPLVFQTVARLNLAARPSSSSSGDSAGTNSLNQATQVPQSGRTSS